MKLAISNIAWKPEEDDEVAAIMRACGADAVEIAPSVYWPDPLQSSKAERLALRKAWADRGFPIVALQSLLFGFPDLNLFDSRTRPAMQDRLIGVLDVAADLGAGVLVFGSPRNRTRGALSWPAALEIAVPFFQVLGAEAERRGVCLCIEPNPTAYGCDFVNRAAEGRAMAEAVDSPGFGLHLDLAGMHLAGDDLLAEIRKSLRWLQHVHVSAAQLGPVGATADIDYDAVVNALAISGYPGNISIEMRAASTRCERTAAVSRALEALSALMRKSP